MTDEPPGLQSRAGTPSPPDGATDRAPDGAAPDGVAPDGAAPDGGASPVRPDRRTGGPFYLVRDRVTDDARRPGASILPGTESLDTDAPDTDAGGLPATHSAGGDDWPWVARWRSDAEPTPWATGLALTGFSALVVGVAVWVLSASLVDRPIVAILVNLLVAAGLAPAMWLSKDLPVLRWIAAGALVGIVSGWISALMMLPMPTP